ncbi:MAG: hypothetical protein LQ337_002823 [Flavoplaca oasis]|nr:MAG: hypothetical protein LQ337_002823 [Flavoplaca oasis]
MTYPHHHPYLRPIRSLPSLPQPTSISQLNLLPNPLNPHQHPLPIPQRKSCAYSIAAQKATSATISPSSTTSTITDPRAAVDIICLPPAAEAEPAPFPLEEAPNHECAVCHIFLGSAGAESERREPQRLGGQGAEKIQFDWEGNQEDINENERKAAGVDVRRYTGPTPTTTMDQQSQRHNAFAPTSLQTLRLRPRIPSLTISFTNRPPSSPSPTSSQPTFKTTNKLLATATTTPKMDVRSPLQPPQNHTDRPLTIYPHILTNLNPTANKKHPRTTHTDILCISHHTVHTID